MTLEEAKKVADILALADGGCPYCVEQLALEANRVFPEYTWVYTDYDIEVSERIMP